MIEDRTKRRPKLRSCMARAFTLSYSQMMKCGRPASQVKLVWPMRAGGIGYASMPQILITRFKVWYKVKIIALH